MDTADLIKAYLRTQQNRYRILEDHNGTSVYRGKMLVATLYFGDAHIICKLMEGRRRISLYHPKSLDLLIETLKCFEFITRKVFDGELDVLDVVEICKDNSAWPAEEDINEFVD